MLGSSSLQFAITHVDPSSAARAGLLKVPHGSVETPAFMPVGTQGSVKAVTPRDLAETGASIILANTYHLALRPGPEVVRGAGGLHRFMAWNGPILTDSGGFQVFSLSTLNKIEEGGVSFRSHIDGEWIHLTPERSIGIQNDLGADIIMAFDQCCPAVAGRAATEEAVSRTARWAERSVAAHHRDDQALFGIVQGGLHEDLRSASAGQITALDFPGYAIGGVSVGETPAEMRDVVQKATPMLPFEKPRYVMGVGRPSDLVEMVGSGVDLFDCVMPTRHARNAALFTRSGLLKMRNLALAQDYRPVDPECPCYTCRTFTRAYLRHLYCRKEMLAGILGTIHNLTFFQRLMGDLREAIRSGSYRELRATYPEVQTPEEGGGEGESA
jgi:queuine tRNA-ribosyltransferase